MPKGTANAATEAANRAFRKSPSLGLEEAQGATAAATKGRRRLSGAFLIDLDRIEPDPQQPRKNIDPTYLRELTASVSRLGILQPITVRYVEGPDRYRVIAGECRYTAAKAAGLREVPCWVKTPKAEDILLHQIIENWQRSDLNPFELADSLAQLRDANNFTQNQLAEATGKSKGEISKVLSILDIAPDVQQLARSDTSGRVSKRHLYAISQLDGSSQSGVLQRVLDRDLTAVDTERLVARMQTREQGPSKGGAPVVRRRFVTRYGTLQFTFRKRDVTAEDLLAVLREVKTQIKEEAGDPADFS